MGRIVLTIALIALASTAKADWIKVTSSDYGEMTVYVDPTTIRNNGKTVKMWNLYDFNSPQGSTEPKYLSTKFQGEYDCKNEMIRVVYSSAHSLNMGDGKSFFVSTIPDEWIPPAPQSVNAALWKFACQER